MTNIKYWVSDLSEVAQKELFTHCRNQLIKEGYSLSVIDDYINELPNEKLGNLTQLVTYDMMIKLSNK